jgi:hypothetical protein
MILQFRVTVFFGLKRMYSFHDKLIPKFKNLVRTLGILNWNYAIGFLKKLINNNERSMKKPIVMYFLQTKKEEGIKPSSKGF